MQTTCKNLPSGLIFFQKAARVIFAVWVGNKVRKEYLRIHHASAIIKTHWLGYHYRTQFIKTRAASKLLLRVFQQFSAKRTYKENRTSFANFEPREFSPL